MEVGMLWMLAATAMAGDWPTTQVAYIETGFDKENPVLGWFSDPFDPAVAMPSAPVAGVGIAAFASQGLKRLEGVNFPAPQLDPVSIDGLGAVYPIYWMPPVAADLKFSPQYYGAASNRPGTIRGNTEVSPLAEVETDYVAGGGTRDFQTSFLGTNTIHEVIHGSQKASIGDNRVCDWAYEGVAEGLAVYAAMNTLPTLPAIDEYWLHRRSYTRSLHRDPGSGYGAASFWRYLAEAWEKKPGTDGLALFADIVRFGPAQQASDQALYAAVDAHLRQTVGKKRPMNLIFAEFLTEYASYGGARYTETLSREERKKETITEATWLDDVFGGCATVDVTPGSSTLAPLKIAPVAGNCIRVNWSGFRSTSLQIDVIGTQEAMDAIHVGEATTTRSRRFKYAETCWDVTQHLEQRLALGPNAKCMLNREPATIGVVASTKFVLGEPLDGAGTTVLVFTNAAEDIGNTQPANVSVAFGSALVQTANGPVTPMKEGEPPLKHGLTNIPGQLHLMAMGDDRMLIDGMASVAVDRETAFSPGGGGEKGLMMRSQEYMTVMMASGAGSMIMKDPMTMGGMRPPIVSVGSAMEGVSGTCGYQLDVKTTVLLDEPHRRKVRLEADLFDPMRMRGEGCDGLKAAWVERAVVEVTAPSPGLYDNGPVRRLRSPTQDVYDDAFGIGPFLGGIAASDSLRRDGPADPALLEQMGGAPPAVPNAPEPEPTPEPTHVPPTPEGLQMASICEELGSSGAFAMPMPMVIDAGLEAAEAQGCLCILRDQARRGEGAFGARARAGLEAATCP